MKQPLDWHRECLSNNLKHLTSEQATLHRVREAVKRDQQDCNFYRDQLIEAERRGLDGFDRERFMKKKKAEGL